MRRTIITQRKQAKKQDKNKTKQNTERTTKIRPATDKDTQARKASCIRTIPGKKDRKERKGRNPKHNKITYYEAAAAVCGTCSIYMKTGSAYY